ncbi:MAG TPA: Vms1/Ankzf1 family peptidyl-tRNA hydrolase [Acidimicrobiales bacterium]|jgi:hypothetical protein|nr:Vms1/Ankzf1 family peptidyl-tRNA hydrolase [Acidimicrobiales bacterium]
MESRGALPAPAIGADDVPDLAGLFDRPGPFLTVYMNTEPDVEQASQHSVARWRNLRRDLEGVGAPADVLDAVEAIVPDAHQNGRTLAVVANGTGVLLSRGELEPITAERGRWAPLPSIGPLLEWRQSSPTHAVVLVDRVGADIALFTPEGGEPQALMSVGSQNQNDPHLRKSQPGGWSQRRFQERAENHWEANMKAVAERLGKLGQLIDLRLVIVAGDVRAVPLLKENLPPQIADRVCEIDGQRAVDGGIDDVADDAVKMVATAVASDTVAILEKFREEKGQVDRATDGILSTLAALAEHRVDTLLVHDDPDDDREAWFSLDPPLAAADPETIKAQGVDDPQKGRLVDVLIHTAFRTGARVRLVPSSAVTEGVGAILRF